MLTFKYYATFNSMEQLSKLCILGLSPFLLNGCGHSLVFEANSTLITEVANPNGGVVKILCELREEAQEGCEYSDTQLQYLVKKINEGSVSSKLVSVTFGADLPPETGGLTEKYTGSDNNTVRYSKIRINRNIEAIDRQYPGLEFSEYVLDHELEHAEFDTIRDDDLHKTNFRLELKKSENGFVCISIYGKGQTKPNPPGYENCIYSPN